MPIILWKTLSLDAAVIITASHNPKEYIGFKTVLNSNYKTVNSAVEINQIILENNKEQKSGSITNIKAQTKVIDSASSYIEALKTEFNTLSFDSFVLDTSNGAGGPIAKKIFEAFDLNPHYINLEPDGAFPNHEPDPTKINNLKQLIQKVNETNSEFGIALDGDGDRIVIISADGKIIEADQYAYLFLPELAETQDLKHIIIDTKISSWFIKRAKSMGFKITTTKTGYYFLKEEMKAKGAVMAFERSTHIIFNDRKHRGQDDGLYNALRFIELIDKKGLEYVKNRLNEVKHFSTRDFTLININKRKEKKILLNKLKKYLDSNKEDYLTIDGVRIDRGEAWAVFRFSNTEDTASITVQAPTEKEALDIVEEISRVLDKAYVEKK